MLSYMCVHRRWVMPPRRPPSNSNSTRRVSQQQLREKSWALTLPASSSHFPWTSFCTENKLTLCRTLTRLSSVCFSRISELWTRRCCTTGTAVSSQTFLCNSLCKHMLMHWRDGVNKNGFNTDSGHSCHIAVFVFYFEGYVSHVSHVFSLSAFVSFPPLWLSVHPHQFHLCLISCGFKR